MKPEIKELCDNLDYARSAVMSCLDSADVLVDLHGLSYWADRVETLRTELKEKM